MIDGFQIANYIVNLQMEEYCALPLQARAGRRVCGLHVFTVFVNMLIRCNLTHKLAIGTQAEVEALT